MTIFQKNRIVKVFTLYIFFSSNNTIVTLVDFNGRIKFTISSGQLNYKNSQKKNQATTQHLAFFIAQKTLRYSIASVNLRVKGLGKGRNSILKDLTKSGLFLAKLYEISPLAFNGCKIVNRSS